MATYQSKYTGAEIDAGIDAAKAALPASGGVVDGKLYANSGVYLVGDITDDSQAATKKYVDQHVSVDSVRYVAQSLTEEQKAQARANIGAAAEEKPREKAEIIVSFAADSVVNNQGVVEAYPEIWCRYTNIIPVSSGDRFSYIGQSVGENYPSVIWYDADQNVFRTEYYDTQAGCLLVTVPQEAAYVRFCSANYGILQSEDEVDDSAKTQFEVLHMAREDEEREIKIISRVGGYYHESNVFYPVDYMSAKRSNPIPVADGDEFYFTGGANGESAAIWYDAAGAILSTISGTGSQLKLTPPDGAVLVRFIAYTYNTDPAACVLVVSYSTDDRTMEYLKGMNYMWGKKYVACGDSLTAGDFAEKTEETWDDATQEYKTYCWHIASRNCMKLVNEARSGSTMHNNGSANAFCLARYTEVPADADYITLCFGLNETAAAIGTLEDTEDTTVMGAWNKVLEYFITNMPYAKIGVIIPDSWCSAAMREALIDVAEYWGIPYLDLTGDAKVPLLVGGRRSGPALSQKAIQLRNAAFQVSDTDSHPNARAHAYRSTIIENFMRSL